jgi:hypothetical protein
MNSLLDTLDDDALENIFRSIVTRIGTRRARKIVEEVENPKEGYNTDEEEVFASHPVVKQDTDEPDDPKCKGCGCVLYSHALYDLCGECEPDDDDGRKCAGGCGFSFHPDLDRDLCLLCEPNRDRIKKRLDEELEEYVSKRVE